MHLSLKNSLGKIFIAPWKGLLDYFSGAKAAYSLRALNTSWVNKDVVEVRRASDDTTSGFTAADMVQPVLDQYVVEGAGTTVANGTYVRNGNSLDGAPAYTLYDGAAPLYSVWRLSGGYWYITPTLDDTANALYLNTIGGETPPLSGWSVATGSPNAPTLTKAIGQSPMEQWVNATVALPLDTTAAIPVSNATFTNDGYETFSGASASGFTASNTTGIAITASQLDRTYIAGEVIRVEFDITVTNGSSPLISLRTGIAGTIVSNTEIYETSGSKSIDLELTASGSYLTFSEGNFPSNFTVSNLTVTNVTGAAAAYSLRDLTTSRTNITSNGDTDGDTSDAWVVQARRSSDDNLKSFTAAEVADGTLETWVGTTVADQGYVTTWYDQSSNGNHGTQTTIAKQPRIVVDGSQVFENLVPAIRPDGVDDTVDIPTISGDNYSVFAKYHAPSDSSIIFRNTGGNTTAAGRRSNTHWYFQFDGVTYDQAIDHPSTPVVANYQVIGTDMMVRGNGVDIWTPQTVPAGTNSNISRIANYLGGTGTVSEVIIYTSDQTDNRKALESNMADFYGVDLDAAADHDSGEDQVDGFVTTWYDQSGQGNDATQAVATSQPKIVDAGVLLKDANGKPEVVFDGTGDWLDATGFTTANGAEDTSIVVGSVRSTGITAAFLDNVSGANDPHLISQHSTGFFQLYAGETATRFYGTADTNQNLHFVYKASVSNQSSGSFNGATTALDAGTDGYTGGVRVGAARDALGAYLNGSISEVIIYDSDQSSNRTGIEGNINTEYNIYP